MIKDIVKGAVKSAAAWVGGTVGSVFGPVGQAKGAEFGSKFAESLMTKKPGASEWEAVSTAVTPPSYGKFSVQTYKAGQGKGPDVSMRTVDAETLNAEWEYRLTRGLRNRNLFT